MELFLRKKQTIKQNIPQPQKKKKKKKEPRTWNRELWKDVREISFKKHYAAQPLKRKTQSKDFLYRSVYYRWR